MIVENEYKGSAWAKWDLHVHTPESYYNKFTGETPSEKWEKYISDLESLPPEFKVIGINDYFFIDGYKRILEERDQGRLPNIKLILPVIEFRLKKFAGSKKLNLHVIFSNEITPEIIQRDFLNRVTLKYHLSHGANGEWWSGTLHKESVIELGSRIKANIPPAEIHKYKSDYIEGVKNINVDEDEIIKLLKESHHFNGKYILALGKTEWDEFSWTDGNIAEKKDIISKVAVVFTASESIDRFQKAKKKLKSQNVNDLLLDCSDAHDYSSSKDKDRIGNCWSWIKADPCFEGLKQIIHEPDTRIHVSENAPFEPLRKINSISLNFPDETFISSSEKTSQQTIFCWSGRKKINFSPYFNCIIGGRGAGKSALLNLIAKKVGLDNHFFSKNILRINESTKILPENNIEIDGTSEIEFISQNEIDKFAENSSRLTDAIYSRIKQITEEDFDLIEQNINTRLEEIQHVIEEAV